MKHTSPYLSAQALGITEAEREALIWVYRGLKSGAIPAKQYNQGTAGRQEDCGTTHCIGGWMARYLDEDPWTYVESHTKFNTTLTEFNTTLSKLFWGRLVSAPLQSGIQACLNTLTLGDPCWDELP